MRKLAETDVPMMPPMILNAPNLELTADAVAATVMEVIITILMSENEVREQTNGCCSACQVEKTDVE